VEYQQRGLDGGGRKTAREIQRDIRERAAAGGDEEADEWVDNQLSGLAKASDDRHDAAVKKATASVRKLYSQGLLSLTSNGNVMYGREGEQKVKFTRRRMKQFGIAQRQYKAAIKEAESKIVLDSKPPAVAKSKQSNLVLDFKPPAVAKSISVAALDSDSDDDIKKPRAKKAASVPKKKIAALDSDSDDDIKKPRAKKAALVPKKKIAALDSESDDDINKPRAKKAASVPKKNIAALDSDSDDDIKNPCTKKAASVSKKKIAALGRVLLIPL
jgi:hypothetical protein